MKSIYWSSLKDLAEEDLSCLGIEEQKIFSRLRFPKRKHEWWLGRVAAKKLLGKIHPEKQTFVQVLNDVDGAPYFICDAGERLPGFLSITHRGVRAAAAWCEWSLIGIDLEIVESRTAGFGEEYFTKKEVGWLSSMPLDEHTLFTNLVWSMKESVLKAFRTGLRRDTRSIEVGPISAIEQGMEWARVDVNAPVPVQGYWKQEGCFIMTLAVLGGENIASQVALIEV
jgi:phosphopantetheinyl transferase